MNFFHIIQSSTIFFLALGIYWLIKRNIFCRYAVVMNIVEENESKTRVVLANEGKPFRSIDSAIQYVRERERMLPVDSFINWCLVCDRKYPNRVVEVERRKSRLDIWVWAER